MSAILAVSEGILTRLNDWDTSAFLLLNGLHSPFWDSLMRQVSSLWVLIPVHLLLLLAIFRHPGWRARGAILCLLALVIAIDLAGARAIKNAVQRVRPCNEGSLAATIHFGGGRRSGASSFVSTHTAYAFAIAGVALFSLAHRRLALALFLWAAVVGYSRVYLGLHYPGDILGGALWGVTAAAALHGVVLLALRLPLPGQRLDETSAGTVVPARVASRP